MSRFFEVISGQEQRQFTHADLPLEIGCGPGADIPLPEETAGSAWLAESRGFLFLQPAEGSAEIFHNDERLNGSVWVKSGDRTRIGNTVLHWSIAGDRVEILLNPAKPVGEAANNGLQPPDADPHPPLPRIPVTAGTDKRPSILMRAASLLLVLLLIPAAVFLLTAHRIDLTIEPEPDSLELNGFPPALVLGKTVLAVNGIYSLSAKKTGYQDLSEQITVSAQQSSFGFSLHKLPGILNITSQPQAARILLDGNPLGETPLAGLRVEAGPHSLQATRARYQPLTRQIEVAGGEEKQKITLNLLPDWAQVKLTSLPAGAEVRLKDELLGSTPLSLELPSGSNTLLFSKKGFVSRRITLDITPMQELTPEPVVLEPAPALVTLRSEPAGAMISVNNTFVGTTPKEMTLPSATPQEIRLQLDGYQAALVNKTFAPESRETVSIPLQPALGTLFIQTDPVSATLFIDNKQHGTATGRLRLKAGTHQLRVEAEGYAPKTVAVQLEAENTRQLTIRLEKKTPVSKVAAPPDPTPSPPPKKQKQFIRLGPATVLMGADRREPGRRANEQQRTVRLVRPFYLAVQPVTNREYRKFFPDHRSGTTFGLSLDGDNRPVVNVSWEDAARYCNRLSHEEGLPEFYREEKGVLSAVSPPNTGYRLPTEAEWAYAARMAGSGKPARYPWKGKFPPVMPSGNFADQSAQGVLATVISSYNDGFPVTSPVGSFPKNPGGFYDLGGNVSQWCHDWYTPYMAAGSPDIDPLGPARGTHHVIRGSSWRDATITTLRLSYRGYGKKPANDVGFRIARYAQ